MTDELCNKGMGRCLDHNDHTDNVLNYQDGLTCYRKVSCTERRLVLVQ
jgi:hypothetical protein